jgi:hypothetical protein
VVRLHCATVSRRVQKDDVPTASTRVASPIETGTHGIGEAAQHYAAPVHRYAYLIEFYFATFVNRSVFFGLILMFIGFTLSVISVEWISIAVGIELLRAIEKITFKHFLLLIGAGLTVAGMLVPE